jgi:F-type H+-transporting ATPase subunit a
MIARTIIRRTLFVLVLLTTIISPTFAQENQDSTAVRLSGVEVLREKVDSLQKDFSEIDQNIKDKIAKLRSNIEDYKAEHIRAEFDKLHQEIQEAVYSKDLHTRANDIKDEMVRYEIEHGWLTPSDSIMFKKIDLHSYDDIAKFQNDLVSLLRYEGIEVPNELLLIEEKEEKFNPTEIILHHIADSHEYHLWNYADDLGLIHPVSIPLPVILYVKDKGLFAFMSSEFHHDDQGKVIVERGGVKFLKAHDHIYIADAEGKLSHDENNIITNDHPLDISITKNVFAILLSLTIILIVFISVARSYASNSKAPKGLAAFIEPLILFVRDDIAIPNIGKDKYQKFMPYLLTVFFFILLNNLMGLIPIFPFGANMTGNIAVTITLASITLLITLFSGNKNYWKHIFMTPGVPKWLLPIMIPVELMGVLSKPFALMIRLFANISAGHIIVLSLVSLIFIFKTVAIAPVSVAFVLFMDVLELLVAFLQAYVFTLLSALFFGLATEDAH